jgi:microcystin-dependent protein
MKKFLLLPLLAIYSFVGYAQTSVTSSGISIQGVARNEKNSALTNLTDLSLTFTLYQESASGNVDFLIQQANVDTDNFGVFSYVLVVSELLYNKINSAPTFLKVSQGSVIFSDEQLQSVPYAISAFNGVPTGSIMPYIGASAPNGWLLCDGSAIDINDYTAPLRSLLGSSNTPNLNGLFLRGTGIYESGKEGPALNQVQSDNVIEHGHSVNINTSSNGNHAHNYSYRGGTTNKVKDEGGSVNAWKAESGATTTTNGSHTHTVTGNTANFGSGVETRPVNYGVNYIIKI